MITVMSNTLKLGVLGSGKGSNLGAIAEAIEMGTLDAEIVCVLSDVEDAGILDLARDHSIDAHFMSAAPFRTKLDQEAQANYIAKLKECGADVIILAGFMRMIKSGLLDAFPDRVINIHPSLLPEFPGLAAWEQAVEAGATRSGCTVHYVDSGMDTGPIILQREVPVYPDDTPETLHARIQIEEHIAYPEAIRIVAEKLARG